MEWKGKRGKGRKGERDNRLEQIISSSDFITRLDSNQFMQWLNHIVCSVASINIWLEFAYHYLNKVKQWNIFMSGIVVRYQVDTKIEQWHYFDWFLIGIDTFNYLINFTFIIDSWWYSRVHSFLAFLNKSNWKWSKACKRQPNGRISNGKRDGIITGPKEWREKSG